MPIKNCHICQAGNLEQLEELEELLPPGYSHLLCTKEKEKVQLRVKVPRKEDVEKWLEDFQQSSGFTWRKARTYPQSGRYNMFRADFRCQHRTYGTGPKNTNCPATLFLVLKRSMEDRRSRSSDKHMAEGYLMNICLRMDHNNCRLCADALSKRDVSSTTTKKLEELFQRGHSPSSALDTLKYDLQEEEGEWYFLTAADRAMVPDIQFCYRLDKVCQVQVEST
ncbi:hypothetical protein ACEWY4_001514 [Coilia grayii]|uniref:Uncharacterized protein n=1 Tax=Coilia grayii TaxID=363190 RepID=A0ABD1KTR6_9TELE